MNVTIDASRHHKQSRGVDHPTSIGNLGCERSNASAAYANVAARHISRSDYSPAPNGQIELRHLASPFREISVCVPTHRLIAVKPACPYSNSLYNADNSADSIVSNLGSVTIFAAAPQASTPNRWCR